MNFYLIQHMFFNWWLTGLFLGFNLSLSLGRLIHRFFTEVDRVSTANIIWKWRSNGVTKEKTTWWCEIWLNNYKCIFTLSFDSSCLIVFSLDFGLLMMVPRNIPANLIFFVNYRNGFWRVDDWSSLWFWRIHFVDPIIFWLMFQSLFWCDDFLRTQVLTSAY